MSVMHSLSLPLVFLKPPLGFLWLVDFLNVFFDNIALPHAQVIISFLRQTHSCRKKAHKTAQYDNILEITKVIIGSWYYAEISNERSKHYSLHRKYGQIKALHS